MKIIGQLKAILGLDKTGFDRGLKDAEKKTNVFSGAIKKLGGIFAGVFAAGKLIQFGNALVDLGGKAEGVRAAFNKLNQPDLLKDLRKATAGTVDDLKLMQYAVRAENINIPLSTLASFFEFATKRASQTGESVDYLTESIINGIGRKSTLVMDNLGISAAELQAEVAKVGDFGLAAGNIIEKGMAKMGDVLVTNKQKAQSLGAAWTNIKTELGERLMPIIGKIAEWGLKTLPKIISVFGGMRRAIVGVINYFIDLYNESILFRGVIQGIIFVARTLWDSFKTGIKTTVGYFGILGQVVKDVFTGNWKAIGDHVRQGLQGIAETTQDYAQSIADNWDKMMEDMTKRPHVQLIEITPVAPGQTAPATTGMPTGAGGGGGTAKHKTESLISTGAGAAALPQVAPALESLTLLQMGIEQTKTKLVDMGKVTDQVFGGLADSFYDAFTSTDDILTAFGKSFGTFIKQLIARMVAATAAALALAVVMSMIPGLGAASGISKGATFGQIFGGLLTKGLGIGMANGGTVPAGFPNDSFGPVMLSSGETVLTAEQSRNLSRGIDITVHGDISGRTIALAGRRTDIEN